MANTGNKIVLTLKEQVDPSWTGTVPTPGSYTGNTKPNSVSDPNYIAPVADPVACPVTSNLVCPVVYAKASAGTVEYELNLVSSVLKNANISKVIVALMQGASTISTNLYNFPLTYGYLNDKFAALAAGTYSLDVKYLDASNVVLATCTGVVTGLNVT